MNDIQQNLILQGDSSGAVQALNQADKAGQRFVDTIQDVDKASAQSTKKAEKHFKDLSKDFDNIIQQSTSKVSAKAGDSVEDVKELGGAIGDLESGLLALEGGGIGAIASIENFANVLLNLPPQMLPVGLAIGAVVGGVAIAFNELGSQMRETSSGIREVMARTEEYYRVLVEGTSEDAQVAIEALETEKSIKELRRAELQEQLSLYEGMPIEIARLSRSIGLDDTVINAIEEYDRLTGEIDQANADISSLTDAMNSGAVQARDLADTIEDYNKAEAELNDQRIAQAGVISDLRLEGILLEDAFEDRLIAEEKLLELQEARRLEDEALTAEYESRKQALEDLYGAEDAQRKLTEDQADLQDKLASLTQKSVDTIKQAENDLLNKRNETQSKLSELETTYQKEAIDRQKEYQQKRQDIEDSFNKTRLQAFASQDAASLFFATLAKDESLADVNKEEKQANEEALQSYKERQAEITAELEAFKESQAEKIAIEQENTAKAIEAEIEAFNESQRLQSEEQQRREERALAFETLENEIADRRSELTKQRAEEDRQARIEADRAVLQDQLTNIDRRLVAEKEAYNEIIAQINAVYFERDLAQGMGFDPNRLSPYPTMQFATGAYFESPTRLSNVLLAENEPEVIIPVSQLGGGSSVSLSIPVTVSGDASEKTIQLIQDAVKSEGMNIVRAVSDTLRLQGRPK